MSEAERERAMTDERLDSLERFRMEMEEKWKAAFPNGDHIGHCGYHELMIEEIRDRKKLIAAVKEKTVAGLVWAAIVGVAIAAWHYLVLAVKKGG